MGRHQICLKQSDHLARWSLFLKVSNPCCSPSMALRMPRCRGFLPKLHQHSCKTAAQTQLIIYATFLAPTDKCPLCCVDCASGFKMECKSSILMKANFFLGKLFCNGYRAHYESAEGAIVWSTTTHGAWNMLQPAWQRQSTGQVRLLVHNVVKKIGRQ